MFEIWFDAAKFALSKEARDSAATLIGMLNRSPAWQKDICTLEAKISTDARERTHLLRDLVQQKLQALSFAPASIKAFGVSFTELSGNAFEHGTRNNRRKIVRVITEVCPTYVATSVFNPTGSPVDLNGWMDTCLERLRDTQMLGRGRGLLSVCRHADVLEAVGRNAIKAVVYRDAVTFETREVEDSTLVVVMTGQSNPSLGRRVVEFAERLNANKIALCLNPNEIMAKELARHADDPGSWVWPEILQLVASYARAGDKSIQIVCGDDDLRALLPKDFASATVAAAIDAMRLRGGT